MALQGRRTLRGEPRRGWQWWGRGVQSGASGCGPGGCREGTPKRRRTRRVQGEPQGSGARALTRLLAPCDRPCVQSPRPPPLRLELEPGPEGASPCPTPRTFGFLSPQALGGVEDGEERREEEEEEARVSGRLNCHQPRLVAGAGGAAGRGLREAGPGRRVPEEREPPPPRAALCKPGATRRLSRRVPGRPESPWTGPRDPDEPHRPEAFCGPETTFPRSLRAPRLARRDPDSRGPVRMRENSTPYIREGSRPSPSFAPAVCVTWVFYVIGAGAGEKAWR